MRRFKRFGWMEIGMKETCARTHQCKPEDTTSVVDPHIQNTDPDPDPVFRQYTDPNQGFFMIQNLVSNFFRKNILYLFHFSFDYNQISSKEVKI